jgi:arylsulfatase A-like enzyme
MFRLLLLLLIPLMSIAQQPRPNIILFVVDDMGWQDTSVPFWKEETPFNKLYRTPNMARLASEGVKFTQAYVTPVCTPTRVSLITGMNAAHHGVTNWTSPWKNNNTDVPDAQFAASNWNINGLSPQPYPQTVQATPFPQLLKEAGYFTIHVGKAHWGSSGTPGSNPYNMGFTVNIAGHSAGHPQSYLSEDNYGNIPGKSSIQAVPDLQEYHGTGTFLTEALTLEAIKALGNPIRQKQPFFLYMGHYAIHVPLMADKRYFDRYLALGLDSNEAKYATLIEGMDKSLGDLMDYLKQTGQEKNTVILFMSDNGGLSTRPSRSGPAHTQNLPLKAGKGSVYEGGIRNPLIIKWPGKAPAGINSNILTGVEDIFPTIMEMAGIRSYKTLQQRDGESLVAALRNPTLTRSDKVLVWHYPNKWIHNDGPGINYHSAIRMGNWKLVYNLRNGKKELYDLQSDIEEAKDVASQYPDIVIKLTQELGTRLRNWKAPMPVVKATGTPLEYPGQHN